VLFRYKSKKLHFFKHFTITIKKTKTLHEIMLKAITFDSDMTLVDFWDFKIKATDAAAKAMVKAGLNMTVKKCQKELFEHYLPDIEGDKVFGDFLKKKKQCTNKILAAGINAYLKEKYSNIKAFPGVKRTLLKLKKKGLKIAVVSDAPKLKCYMRLDAIGLSDVFDVVVAYDDTNVRKPSFRPFLMALKKLGVRPSEAMHVGDAPDKDIKGAVKMGMVSCFAKYGFTKRFNHGGYYKADHVLDKFEDVLSVVKELTG